MAQKDMYNYGANYSNVQVVTAKDAFLRIEGTDLKDGYLLQNVTIRYSRPTILLREMGSRKGYQFKQPPMGVLTIDSIVGTKDMMVVLKEVLDKTKDAFSCTITMGEKSRTLSGCRAQGLSLRVAVGQTFVSEQVTIRFGAMG